MDRSGFYTYIKDGNAVWCPANEPCACKPEKWEAAHGMGYTRFAAERDGLLRRLAQLAPTAFGEGNRLFTEFKGALTENYVLQSLIPQFEVMLRYWTQTNPPYEVEFLIQRGNDIFPVEVKSEANTTSKSLKKFKELFQDQVKLCVRFSLDNLKLDGDVLNIPLFMADQADRLIGLALEKQ